MKTKVFVSQLFLKTSEVSIVRDKMRILPFTQITLKITGKLYHQHPTHSHVCFTRDLWFNLYYNVFYVFYMRFSPRMWFFRFTHFFSILATPCQVHHVYCTSTNIFWMSSFAIWIFFLVHCGRLKVFEHWIQMWTHFSNKNLCAYFFKSRICLITSVVEIFLLQINLLIDFSFRFTFFFLHDSNAIDFDCSQCLALITFDNIIFFFFSSFKNLIWWWWGFFLYSINDVRKQLQYWFLL